jgi:hypothetical protein
VNSSDVEMNVCAGTSVYDSEGQRFRLVLLVFFVSGVSRNPPISRAFRAA